MVPFGVFMSGFGAITLRALRAMPPFVFLSEKEKRRFCLKHVISLKSLKPEYLDQSSNWFSKCERPLIDEPMAITKPAVPCAQLLCLGSTQFISNNYLMYNNKLTRFVQSLSQIRQNRESERKALPAGCGA